MKQGRATVRSVRHALSLAVVVFGLSAALARAEVWAFIDENNVPHFSDVRVDARYQPFSRGDFIRQAARERATPQPGDLTQGEADGRPFTRFENSPLFQSVSGLLSEAARAHDLDAALLQALVATESGFNPRAVSPRGAIGLMQIMPATAERYGLSGDRRTPLARKLADPALNVRTGARYLRDLINMFPNRLDLALAAYNAGEGAVQRAGNRIPQIRETQNYVKAVMQLYASLRPTRAAAATLASATPASDPAARSGQPMPRVSVTLPGGATGRANMPDAAALASRTLNDTE